MGLVSDRYGRKPALTAGLALFGAAGTGLASTADFRTTVALRPLPGVGYTGIAPILIAATGDLFTGDREATAQGLRFTTVGLSLALVPVPSVRWFGFLTYNSIVVVRLLGGTPGEAGTLVGVGSVASTVGGTQVGRLTAAFDTRRTPSLVGTAVSGVGLVALAAPRYGFGAAVRGTLLSVAVGGIVVGTACVLLADPGNGDG